MQWQFELMQNGSLVADLKYCYLSFIYSDSAMTIITIQQNYSLFRWAVYKFNI